MTREWKSAIASAGIGLIVGLSICIAFGVLDVQCYGTEKQNWNPENEACE